MIFFMVFQKAEKATFVQTKADELTLFIPGWSLDGDW